MMECSFYDVPCIAGWTVEEIKSLVLWFYHSILSGLASIIGAIPVPGFMQSVSQFQLPDSVVYFADVFAIPEGVGIVVSASILRFIIRRIPVIG